MSRNLGSRFCEYCEHPVVLLEEPRPCTEADCHQYFEEYRGMIVAQAHCPMCLAQYLAWIDQSQRVRYADDRPPFGQIDDLSHLSTFNDEPGESDRPVYDVQKIVNWVRTGPYVRRGRDG